MSYLKQLPSDAQRKVREMFANGYGHEDIYVKLKSYDNTIDSKAVKAMVGRMHKRRKFEEFRKRKSA